MGRRTLGGYEAWQAQFRLYGDDGAIVGGLARIDGRRVIVVGHQKGADTDENIRRLYLETIRKSPLPIGIYDQGTYASVLVVD